MKGFKDSNNKFHPITQSKGVRKSRNQKTKQDGVKIRKRMSGYDRWVTSAPPDPEEEALDIVVTDNLNLTAEQIAKIKPSWWDDDDTDTIGDLFTVGTIQKKLTQEREMNEYFDEEARKHGRKARDTKLPDWEEQQRKHELENLKRFQKGYDMMGEPNDIDKREPAMQTMKEILISATKDGVDSTGVDFPNAFDASTYRMIMEGLGRSYVGQQKAWSREGKFNGKLDDQLFWLKYTRKQILEFINNVKQEDENYKRRYQ